MWLVWLPIGRALWAGIASPIPSSRGGGAGGVRELWQQVRHLATCLMAYLHNTEHTQSLLCPGLVVVPLGQGTVRHQVGHEEGGQHGGGQVCRSVWLLLLPRWWAGEWGTADWWWNRWTLHLQHVFYCTQCRNNCIMHCLVGCWWIGLETRKYHFWRRNINGENICDSYKL